MTRLHRRLPRLTARRLTPQPLHHSTRQVHPIRLLLGATAAHQAPARQHPGIVHAAERRAA